MGTSLRFILCAVLISGNILSVYGTVYSNTDTVLRFSQCLIEKMGQSQIFTVKDRNDMMEVANVMSETLLSSQTKLSPRTVLTAFVTSMAGVIIHEDVAMSADRKVFYAGALEQCSLSSTGYSDDEFIELALMILSYMEKRKQDEVGSKIATADTYNRNANPEGISAFNPLSVQPSPVQNPYIPGNFNPNDKTNFEPAPDFHPAAINTNPLFQVQFPSNAGISPGAEPMTQQEPAAVASKNLQESGPAPLSETSASAFSFGGVNVPQTKESSVVVIPPAVNKQPIENYPLPQLPVDTGEIIMQPSSMDRAPLPPQTSADAGSPLFPQANAQNQDAPPSYSSENIILNSLTESLTFRNSFNFNTPPEAAISLARSVTSKSLEGYNLDIVNEALTAVTDEIAKVSFHTPENYALAISNALVRVLKLFNLPLSTNGSQIAASFISNLENAKEFPPQAQMPQDPSSGIYYPTWNEKQVDFDFESPPLAPENTEGAIFSKVLAQYLSESSELSKFFCDTDISENKMKIYFPIIKSSLTGYKRHVPRIAASIASGALAELPKEELCSRYAKTISDVIAEILDENGIIKSVDAERIAKQMELSLIQLNVTPDPQNTEKTTSNPPQKEAVSEQTTLQPSQSSFSSNFDNIKSNSFSPEYVTYEQKNYPTTYALHSEKYDGTTSNSFSAPSSPSQISSNSDVNSYTVPITASYAAEITDEEFTSAASLMELITSATETPPTEILLDWAPSGAINQEELASYLLEELETVLESYYKEDSDTKDLSSPTDDIPATDEVTKGSDALPPSPQSEKKVQDGNTTHSNRKENRRSQCKSEKKVVPPDHVSAEGNDNRSTKQKSPLTERSSVKKDLVELQPSFLGPQSEEYPAGYDITSGDLSSTETRAISQIATSSIAYIRSGNFNINNLCDRINELAPIVDIPPLRYCKEVPAIDYLLNVLNSVMKMLRKV